MVAIFFSIQSNLVYSVKSIFTSMFLIMIVFTSIRAEVEDYPGRKRYFEEPRESAIPGKDYSNVLGKYNSISSGGDLLVNIPLFTVPGKIPVPVELSYKSGIKVDQMASWVGLGWNLGGWSVQRNGVHGDDQSTVHYIDIPATRYNINDVFTVNIPGRSVKFINVGTMKSPNFVPLSYSNDSLFADTTYRNFGGNIQEWEYYEYDYFVMVDAERRRYVFQDSCKRMVLDRPDKDLVFSEYSDCNLPQNNCDLFGKMEWMLTAILDHDYVDGGGNPLDPTDGTDPLNNNKGGWVAFKYLEEKLAMGPYHYATGDDHEDTTDVRCLTQIITPNSFVKFQSRRMEYSYYNANYKTMRYIRSGHSDAYRVQDMVLKDISVYGYPIDTSELNLNKTHPSYRVSFEYSDTPLKKSLHEQWTNTTGTCNGELTLSAVKLSYALQPSSAASGIYDHIQKSSKRYNFDYVRDLDMDFPFYHQFPDSVYKHSAWTKGDASDTLQLVFPHRPSFNASSFLTNKDTLSHYKIFSKWWGGRDFFGYYVDTAGAWSLSSMTTPEGLVYQYKYDWDKYKVPYSGNVLNTGCRVDTIIVNPDRTGLPESRDNKESDTIAISYSDNASTITGIGRATSMPANFHSYISFYSDQIVYSGPSGYILGSGSYKTFLPDNASHDIIYPRINWKLSRDRGTIDHFYTSADFVSNNIVDGNKERTMTIYFAVPGCPGCDSTYHYYSIWQDRSPLLSLNYKTVAKDQAGTVVSKMEKFYSFPATAAVLAPANDQISGHPSFNFPAGDTLAACYFVRVDSTADSTDGMGMVTKYQYDNLKRMNRVQQDYGPYKKLARYTYASDFVTAMRDKHYLSALQSERNFYIPSNDSLLTTNTVYEYRSNFPSQNLSGQNSVWYFANKKEWFRQSNNELATLDTINHDGQYLVDSVIDVDKYGHEKLIRRPDGTKIGYVSAIGHAEGVFENVKGNDFALFTGEGPLNNQDGSWFWSSHGVIDSSTSFTGNKCGRIPVGTVGQTRYGPTVRIIAPPTGIYVAEFWGKTSETNKLRVTINGFQGGQILAHGNYVMVANEWTRVACTLSVTNPDSIKAFCAKEDAAAAYIDDFRVYPLSAKVSTETRDAMLRVTSNSDFNNLPVRTAYNRFGEPMVTTDYQNKPLSGSENYYATTDSLNDAYQIFAGEYGTFKTNSSFSFKSSKSGFFYDFAKDPRSQFTISGNDSLGWDPLNQVVFHNDRIKSGTSSYVDIVIPVDSFSNGAVALTATFLKDINPIFEEIGGPGDSLSATQIWIGFENNQGQGYGTATAFAGVGIFKYNGQAFANRETLQFFKTPGDAFHLPIAWIPDQSARLMIVRLNSYLYAFFNNDCIMAINDPTYGIFDRIRIRLKEPGLNGKGYMVQMDDLVFYNEPIVTSQFINSYGLPKQTQMFDGDRIIVSGQRNNNDGKTQLQFKPVKVSHNPVYDFGSGNYLSLVQNAAHRTPFDIVRTYSLDTDIYDWVSGDTLKSGSYLHQYYKDSVQGGACGNYAYTQFSYDDDPLMRAKEVKHPCDFRTHPATYAYGRCDSLLTQGSFSYPIGTISKHTSTDENGNRSLSYLDQFGRTIFTQDSISGQKIITNLVYDVRGNLKHIVRPVGDSVKKVSTLNGQLVRETSPDFGSTINFYDQVGQIRFTQSATDSVAGRFHFYMYDSHGRLVKEGIYTNPAALTWANAFDPTFPDTTSASTKVTAKYEYDNGDFANGLLTKATRIPSGVSDSASWESYKYDYRGRVIEKKAYVYPIDLVTGPRIFTASYNYGDQLILLTYPNGHAVNYTYNLAGQPVKVSDDNSWMKAVVNYWPSGNKKSKQLGFSSTVQTVDYNYNERDWLTTINNNTVNSLDTGTGDHYSLKLAYDSLAYLGACPGGGGPCQYDSGYYNGNVSSYTVKVSPGTGSRKVTYKFAYDEMDRMLVEFYDETSVPDYGYEYVYDKNGNIDKVKSTSTGVTLNDYILYPGTNRVEQITNLAGGTNNFQYTPSGSMNLDFASSLYFNYNFDEQLSKRQRMFDEGLKDVSFWYNTGGRRILKRHHYFTPDPSCVEDPPPDPLGMMSQSMAGPGDPCPPIWHTEYEGFYYFGDQLHSEYDYISSATLSGNYVYLNGERVAEMAGTANSVRYYLNDHLGSVVATVDKDGKLKNWYQHEPYGRRHRSFAADEIDFGFNGHVLDEELSHDLYYYGARYYDPTYRIFTSIDPKKDLAPGWGPYVYTMANPVKYTDPNGKWAANVHNTIIDKAFSGIMTSDQRSVLRKASRDVDRDQSVEGSFKHAMRAPGQTAEEAQELMDAFVQSKTKEFMEGSGNEALYSLGEAFHALMDQTSPAHAGFQEWKGSGPNNWGGVLIHVSREVAITKEQLKEIVKILRDAYEKALAEKQAKEEEERKKREEEEEAKKIK